jgi:hypothetical protein
MIPVDEVQQDGLLQLRIEKQRKTEQSGYTEEIQCACDCNLNLNR